MYWQTLLMNVFLVAGGYAAYAAAPVTTVVAAAPVVRTAVVAAPAVATVGYAGYGLGHGIW